MAHVTLAPFSRGWWGQWCYWAQRGVDVRAMSAAAIRGKPWMIRREVAASDFGFVAVAVDSPAFAAWSVHFLRHGVALPRPARAPVIFMPSAMPTSSAVAGAA